LPSPAQLGVPRSLRSQATVVNKSTLKVTVHSTEERQAAVQQLISAGWVQDSSSGRQTQMHRPKKLRGPDIAAIVYGFFCFLLPAVIYFIMWSNKPIPVLVVEQVGTGISAA
jgi:hypothetical protein